MPWQINFSQRRETSNVKLKIKMFKTSDFINRDFYMQEFNTEFWLQQTDWRPIISLDSFIALIWTSMISAISMDISKYMLVIKRLERLEFLPTVSPSEFYTALITGVSADWDLDHSARNGKQDTITFQDTIYTRP